MGLKENQEKLKTRHDVILIFDNKTVNREGEVYVPVIGDLVDTPLCRGKVIWREKTPSGWRVGVKLPDSFVPSGTLD
jgi:hypothetical protein